MIDKFFRSYPYLKPVRIHNLYERFLKESNNTVIIAYNKSRDYYEMHSIISWMCNGSSLQCIIPEDTLNGWLLHDFHANNIEKFGQDVKAEIEFNNSILDNYADRGFELLNKRALTTVEKMIGRDL